MKPDDRFPAVGSDTGQFGVALDLDAPALVIGQVPVKPVDLVQGEDVNKFFDICSPGRNDVRRRAWLPGRRTMVCHGFRRPECGFR